MLKKINLFSFFKWLILLTGAAAMLLPFLWMVITSIKINSDIISYPPVLIPNQITFERYRRIFNELNFGRYFFNSIYISVIVTAAVLFTSSILGYVFA